MSEINSKVNYNYLENLVQEIKNDISKLEKKVEEAKKFKKVTNNKDEIIAAETLIGMSDSYSEPIAKRTRSKVKKYKI